MQKTAYLMMQKDSNTLPNLIMYEALTLIIITVAITCQLLLEALPVKKAEEIFGYHLDLLTIYNYYLANLGNPTQGTV